MDPLSKDVADRFSRNRDALTTVQSELSTLAAAAQKVEEKKKRKLVFFESSFLSKKKKGNPLEHARHCHGG